MQVYEVFRQEEPGGAYVHAGSVNAPDMELACQYARDIFSRREDAYRLWVAPRAAIREVTDLDLLRPQLDRRYRLGRGYRVTVEKRRRVKARVQGAADGEGSGSAAPEEAPT